ncbi:MAG: Phosphoesterase [uncultured Sulfurovum sp.]|uniref:Phosphoesterase n=1 Tax=uncultured Sulfurovum sp. TaxID=269237 RepID=A0A6S6TIY1_9BACT|nr:MAG: Phosphoesterase [uncultured Sulfurovum sp.]
MIEAFKTVVEKHEKITILATQVPTGDTLGTGLGIYAVLKSFGKQVEICNLDKKLPNHLDFLPHFARIKRQIDFDNSLIITCGSASTNIVGFDLSLREIVPIVDGTSTSMLAYGLLKDDFVIDQVSATCFYVGLVTETQNFSTLNLTQNVFRVASELVAFGVDISMVNKNLMQRKSLSSLRILSRALDSLVLSSDAQIASMVLTKESLEKTGADARDVLGIIEHGMALATVKIAILLVEFEEKIEVSFRSDRANVAELARHFGGGGQLMASGFSTKIVDLNRLLDEIEIEIKNRRLVNEL